MNLDIKSDDGLECLEIDVEPDLIRLSVQSYAGTIDNPSQYASSYLRGADRTAFIDFCIAVARSQENPCE